MDWRQPGEFSSVKRPHDCDAAPAPRGAGGGVTAGGPSWSARAPGFGRPVCARRPPFDGAGSCACAHRLITPFMLRKTWEGRASRCADTPAHSAALSYDEISSRLSMEVPRLRFTRVIPSWAVGALGASIVVFSVTVGSVWLDGMETNVNGLQAGLSELNTTADNRLRQHLLADSRAETADLMFAIALAFRRGNQ